MMIQPAQSKFDFKSTANRRRIIDLFAGAGGTSLGLQWALGRDPDYAANHDTVACGVHLKNHPTTIHLRADVREIDPRDITEGKPVALLWASPDCRHFSRAKGSRPTSPRVRSLAWVVLRWAAAVAPDVIMLENVAEIADWCPLVAKRDKSSARVTRADGTIAAPGTRTPISEQQLVPCSRRKGRTWRRFIQSLRTLGYAVEWRQLRACDYGAPTIRTRLFLIARRDGLPIRWPEPTHGNPASEGVRDGRMKPWPVAADIIDWSLPTPSLFLDPDEARRQGCRRPLKPATLARIAAGLRRYVLEAEDPYIVPALGARKRKGRRVMAPLVMPITHAGRRRSRRPDEPMPTETTANRGEQALIAAWIAQHNKNTVGASIAKPLGVTTTRGTQQYLAAAYISQHNGMSIGSEVTSPARTVTRCNKQALVRAEMSGQVDRSDQVSAFLATYYGTAVGQDPRAPVQTVTTKPRQALVTVRGMPVIDIGMRMLTVAERAAAQGFPPDYVLDRQADGTPVSKTDQGRLIGNSVCPQVACALARANLMHLAASTPTIAAAE
ncbi:DNA cytosine methyltransferase [Tistrella bauzanensis]|uniref:DNA cytosine methyltransferase n=1 Tax=Tistrella TaxID=171436 RepID=UPI0031F693B8